MPQSYKFPVPANPPNEGSFITVAFSVDWMPILLALLQSLQSPAAWEDPPPDIVQQVDELLTLLQTNLD